MRICYLQQPATFHPSKGFLEKKKVFARIADRIFHERIFTYLMANLSHFFHFLISVKMETFRLTNFKVSSLRTKDNFPLFVD